MGSALMPIEGLFLLPASIQATVSPNAVLVNKIIRCIFLCSCVFMSRFGRDLNPTSDG